MWKVHYSIHTRLLGNDALREKTLTINFAKKYKIYATKSIPLESSFEYESNGIILVHISHIFLTKINDQSFSQNA
jgi:hypothetical protein